MCQVALVTDADGASASSDEANMSVVMLGVS